MAMVEPVDPVDHAPLPLVNAWVLVGTKLVELMATWIVTGAAELLVISMALLERLLGTPRPGGSAMLLTVPRRVTPFMVKGATLRFPTAGFVSDRTVTPGPGTQATFWSQAMTVVAPPSAVAAILRRALTCGGRAMTVSPAITSPVATTNKERCIVGSPLARNSTLGKHYPRTAKRWWFRDRYVTRLSSHRLCQAH